ncbi:MAG: hypothetical protein EPN21_01380 [Methylococcaceae bacterium]|nr:MAG: hypothetical protein EPN21_01380 [Methylococcaceae bacterium]
MGTQPGTLRVPCLPSPGNLWNRAIRRRHSSSARQRAKERIDAEETTRPKPDQVDFRLHLEHRRRPPARCVRARLADVVSDDVLAALGDDEDSVTEEEDGDGDE